MESFSRKKFRRAWVTAVVVCLGSIPVTVATAASTTDRSNEVMNLAAPKTSWGTNDVCNTIDYSKNLGKDIYHFLVSPENKRDYKLAGDFLNPAGSVTVRYEGDSTTSVLVAADVGINMSGKENQIYVAVATGKVLAQAWLNYKVKLVSGSLSPLPTYLPSGNHILSHACAYPMESVSFAVPSGHYSETWDETYHWDLEKSLVLETDKSADETYFDQGLKPKFRVTARRASDTVPENFRVTPDSQYVVGTFKAGGLAVSDVSMSVKGANATCSVTDKVMTDDHFEYRCDWTTETTLDNDSQNGLNGHVFALEAKANGSDEVIGTTDVMFGDQDSGKGVEKNASASLADNLAGLGGIVTACTNPAGDSCVGDATIDSEKKLSLSAMAGTFWIEYTVDWDWSAQSEETCDEGFTNRATLQIFANGVDSTVTTVSQPWTWETKCPTPTVTLGSGITSSYDVDYDETYSWSFDKQYLGQNETNLNARYRVTAHRTVSTISNVKVTGGTATVTGSYTTMFAPATNVSVEITFRNSSSGCDETPDRELDYAGTFTCHIIGLTQGLTDKNIGLAGENFWVDATVTGTGGTGENSIRNSVFGSPSSFHVNRFHSAVQITDNLGAVDSEGTSNDIVSYRAVKIDCKKVDAEGKPLLDLYENPISCWDQTSRVISAGQGPLVTAVSTEDMVLTYEIDWLADFALSSSCNLLITNVATLVWGTGNRPTASASTGPLNCPTATLSVMADPTYQVSWDESYDWRLVKTYNGQDPTTWNPKYTLTATRLTTSRTNFHIPEGTQQVGVSVELLLNPSGVSISTAEIDPGFVMDGATCAVPQGLTQHVCTVSDETTVEDASGTGLKGTTFTVTAAARVFGDDLRATTNAVTWGDPISTVGATAVQTINKTVKIFDDLAGLSLASPTAVTTSTNGWTSEDIDATTYTFDYSIAWQGWKTGKCNENLTNIAQLVDSKGEPIPFKNENWETVTRVSVVAQVTCPTQTGGLTIGYWGNKMGGKEVIANLPDLKVGSLLIAQGWRNRHIKTLGTIGTKVDKTGKVTEWSSDSDVRDYMNKANCSTDCKSMFLAQSLATEMNSRRSSEYAKQWVMFRGACTKVQALMEYALDNIQKIGDTTEPVSPTVLDGPIATRIAYKSIFDDLNNNRATRCPGS